MDVIEGQENLEPRDENSEDIESTDSESQELLKTIPLSGMYENWFLDYASYVILERAVPDLKDGFKPVHRRLMHSMKDLDDGRFTKVANIIGHTMKYHPHGDASIGDALVQIGQKDLLIDCQGNWGNILTGDSAAASRYIEARLSKFALEVLFNPKTTDWKLSYDGRNKEPVALPVKFPLLLAQGVEGIAVGLASKLLPHNFNELIDASIDVLNGRNFEIYPDFPTGGTADISKYNDGLRGGRVRVRARINQVDKKTLSIYEIPFGTTTTTLIESIISANDKGKIKIKKIEDNTAENVEIQIHLAAGVSPDQTIDALYAFSNCEMSVSPNSCVIDDNKPRFLGVKEILKIATENTVHLLKRELEIHKAELEERWHFSSLEKIFIEKRIYRNIEESETWESVIEEIDKGLAPYKKLFKREITTDDIIRLTEIKIKRISKFDAFKADDIIKGIEDELEKVIFNLAHLIDYAIDYYKNIKKKYGKGRERKTELRNFENIEATMVAATNEKLYVNREEGFIGTSLRKDEFVCDCSDIDDIIVFLEDGRLLVTKVSAKTFVGQNIIHLDVFKKNDDRTIYNMIYRDGKNGKTYMKRFPVKGVTRDKEYILTKGTPDSKVLYFTANPNGEAEVVKVKLRPRPKLKKLAFELDFSELAIKGRGSMGNTVTKHTVSKISLKEDGVSTLGARDIWFDETVLRLNTEKRGSYLGAFKGEDKILTVLHSGEYKLYNFDLSSHFDENITFILKYNPNQIWSAVYYDGNSKNYFVKRFLIETSDKKQSFILEHPDSELVMVTKDRLPQIEIVFNPKNAPKNKETDIVNIAEFIDVKGYKAKGKRLTNYDVKKFKLLEPLPFEGDEEATEMPLDELGAETDSQEEIEEIENGDLIADDESDGEEKVIFSKMEILDDNETDSIDDNKVDEKMIEAEKPVKVKPVVKKKKVEKPLAEIPNKKDIEIETEVPEKEIPVIVNKETPIEVVDELKSEVAEKQKKPTKKKASKPAKKKEAKDISKISMNGDETLQMELDF